MATTGARNDEEEAPVVATIVVEMPRAGEEESRLATQKALRAYAKMQPRKAQKLGALRSLAGCLTGTAGGVKGDDSDGDGYGRVVSATPGPRFLLPKAVTSPAPQQQQQRQPTARSKPATHYPTLAPGHRLTPPRPRSSPKRPAKSAALPAAAPMVVQVQPVTVTVKYFRIGPPGSPRHAKARSPRAVPRSRSPSMSGTTSPDSVSSPSPAVITRTSSSGSVAAQVHHAASSEMQSEVEPEIQPVECARPQRRSGGEYVRQPVAMCEQAEQAKQPAAPGTNMEAVQSEAQPVQCARPQRRSGGEYDRQTVAMREQAGQAKQSVMPSMDAHQPEAQPVECTRPQRRSGGEYVRRPAAMREQADHATDAKQATVPSTSAEAKQTAMPDAVLDAKERRVTPELLAASGVTAVAAPAIHDLSARSMPILSTKYTRVHDRKPSLDATYARRANQKADDWEEGHEDVLQRAAQRVVNLLTRTSRPPGEANQEPEQPSSSFARRGLQEEASPIDSPPVLPFTVQESFAATEAWLQQAAAPEAAATPTRAAPEALRILECSKPQEKEGAQPVCPASPTPVVGEAVEQYCLTAQRSYSCASDASNRYLTHASSAAVEDLPSSDDDIDAGMAELEQHAQAWRAVPTAAGQVARPATAAAAPAPQAEARPQLARIVSFALSVGSDDPSSGASDSDSPSEGAADEVQAAAAPPPQLGRATSFALSIGSKDSLSSASCGSKLETVAAAAEEDEQVLAAQAVKAEQYAVPETQLARTVSDAVSTDSYGAISAASEGTSLEAEAAEEEAVAWVANPVAAPQLHRLVSFAVSVGSDDALTSEASAVYSGSCSDAGDDDAVAELEHAPQQQQQPQLARAVSFALSIGSDEGFSTASSTAFTRDGSVSAAEDGAVVAMQGKAVAAPTMPRVVSYALSVGSDAAVSASSNCFSVASYLEEAPRQMARPASVIPSVGGDTKGDVVTEEEVVEGEAPVAVQQRLGRAVSFAVDAGSEPETDSGAESVREANNMPKRQLGRLSSFAVEVSSGSDSSASAEAGAPTTQRQIGRLTSFAVEVSSGSDSSASAEADVDPHQRRLGKLASFALEVGSQCSSSDGEAARDAQARRYGRVTSFPVPVGSNGDSGSEAGDEARVGVSRTKSFAISVSSDCDSDASF